MRYMPLLLCGLLAGCASVPPTPLPYHFVIADISDARPSPAQGGDDPLYEAYPYDAGQIALGLVNNLPYSVYGAREAKLHLRVTHYQATSNAKEGSYAVSIGLEGYADDDSAVPQKIGKFSASCSDVQREGFALDAVATEMVAEKSLAPLTPAGRDRRMWRAVMDGCTRELARQFSAAISAGK